MMNQPPEHDFHDPVIEDRVAEIMRKKSPSERLEIAFGIWRSVRDMVTRVVKSQNPGWSIEEVRKETARRMYSGNLGFELPTSQSW